MQSNTQKLSQLYRNIPTKHVRMYMVSPGKHNMGWSNWADLHAEVWIRMGVVVFRDLKFIEENKIRYERYIWRFIVRRRINII